MKIGIISEFRVTNVNYGNNMQAYALNKYLQNNYPKHQIESIYFKNEYKMVWTSFTGFVLKKIQSVFRNLKKKKQDRDDFLLERKNAFSRFAQKNILLCPEPMNWKLLKESDYDLFIVGSDVVWSQFRFCVNRIKFLDFSNAKNAIKASYAASFGRKGIPGENRKYIKKCLSNFLSISVREKSSVKFLDSIGIPNVVHTLDPTLLIDAEHWGHLEIKPDGIRNRLFVFVYLLGMDIKQRKQIEKLCRKEGLMIVTIPYACGIKNEADEFFGDVRLTNCAPEEWIWLIHHAELVITDSFHGTVFSTIFKKNFLVVRRDNNTNADSRIDDYLCTVRQIDKKVDLYEMDNLSGKIWDYNKISFLISEKKKESMKYLDDLMQRADKQMH